MKQYLITFITKKGGEEDHEFTVMAENAKHAVEVAKEIWYSENTKHAFGMKAKYLPDVPDTEELSPEQPENVSETETAETTPEVSEPETPAQAETPEKSDDVTEVPEPETYPSLETIISEIPFDLKIKPLCRKCKHLGSCYIKHPSKVFEDASNSEHCDGVCGDCTLCCSDYKPLIEFPETPPELIPETDDTPF